MSHHHTLPHVAQARSSVMALPEPRKVTVFPEIPAPINKFLTASELLLGYDLPKGNRMPSMGEIAEVYMLANVLNPRNVPKDALAFADHIEANYVWSSTRGLRSQSRLATIGKGGDMRPAKTLSVSNLGSGAVLTEGDGPVAVTAELRTLHITADTIKNPNFKAEIALIGAPDTERQGQSFLSRVFRGIGTH